LGHVEKLWTVQGHLKDYKMKYIVGASVGGLFGIGMPLMFDVQEIKDDNYATRQEEPQPVEEGPPTSIDPALTLPDNFCEYIEYESADPKEQAKECLKRSILAVPSI